MKISTLLRASSKLAVGAVVMSVGLSPLFAGATITGKVTLDGTAPKDKTIKMSADPACDKLHAEPAMNDNYTVNGDGTIQNVFVYVEGDPLKGKAFTAPAEAVPFDQKGCQYRPKVLGIMVNQPFEIINSDPTLHNVHALPQASGSKEFNLGMPTQGQKAKKTFVVAEKMVKIKCDVHPWMFAYVGVMEHPYYSATGDGGSYTIKDLPPGKYTLYAWHNKFANPALEMPIEVTEGETKTFDITMKAPAGN